LKLTLLYREDCGLCDEMLLELEQLGQRIPLPPLESVDVDSDPELEYEESAVKARAFLTALGAQEIG